ncbi:MAG: nicotinate-nucleotide adenylyltransferase [Bacteroidetes bacterium]|nr:nicotinate-nucleotide adenylyltransferase [Bacteroidota bacterium]
MGKQVGLFFGSFNPIHVGHLIIANHILQNSPLQEIWFVVSPQNPFKAKNSLLDERQRLYMVNLAVEDNYQLRSSAVEFDLPVPSYTVDTLAYLQEKHPSDQFSLLMGSDNLESIEKWKNYSVILDRHPLYVYHRPGYDAHRWKNSSNIHFADAPQLLVSASFIREQIQAGKSVQYLLTEPVYRYVEEMNFYKVLKKG